LPLTTIRRTLPLATPQRLTPTGKSGRTDEAPRAPRRGASPPTVALQIDGTSRGDLPVVTRGAAANAGYFCGPVPGGVCRLQAQGMSRGPALPGEMGEAGDDGSDGDRPPSDAAPRGPGWKLGAAACAAETKRNAQPVLQTRPAGRLPSGRPDWAAPAPKPALAQRPPESGPGLTIRALSVPSRTDTSGHERSTTAHANRP
jgi:hypothetical protein